MIYCLKNATEAIEMRRNPDLLAGTILRMERLRQGAEQKAVCYGLCVPSYLCKIEQGAVHPNPDLLSALFRRLGVDYTQDEARLRPSRTILPAWNTVWRCRRSIKRWRPRPVY